MTKNSLQQIARSPLARAWSWMVLGNGFRIISQSVVFLCVISYLGPETYGTLLSLTAIACLLATFTGLGLGPLMVQLGSRNPAHLPQLWKRTLISTLTTGAVLCVVGYFLEQTILEASLEPWVVLYVLVTEIILLRIVDIAAAFFQSVQEIRKSAEIQFNTALTRAVAAILFASPFVDSTLQNWVGLSSAAVLISAIYCLAKVQHRLHSFKHAAPSLSLSTFGGLAYATETFVQNLGGEMHRILLMALAGPYAAGIYGAAYRMIEIASVPVRSLIYSAQAKFFIEGGRGLKESVRLGSRLMPIALGASFISGVGLVVGIPVLTSWLTPKFAASAAIVYSLSLAPLLRAGSLVTLGALTGAGHQKLRTWLTFLTAVLNILLCVALIPKYSIWAAVGATLLTDCLLWLCGSVSVRRLKAKQPTSNGQVEPIKVLIVTEATQGGTRKHVLELVQGLLTQYPVSYEVHLIYSLQRADKDFLEALPEMEKRGVRLKHVEMVRALSPLSDLKAFFEIFVYIQLQRIEIAHGHSAKGGMLARLAATFVPGTKRIYTPHSSPFRLSKAYHWIEWLAAKFLTDSIIAVSESEQQELIQAGIGNARTVHKIYNGIAFYDDSKERPLKSTGGAR